MLRVTAVFVSITLGFSLAEPAHAAADSPLCSDGASGVIGSAWFVCAGAAPVRQVLPAPLVPDGLGSDRSGVAAARGPEQPSVAAAQTFCTYSPTDTLDGTAAPAPRTGGGQWVFVYCGDSGQPGGWTWVAAGAARVVLPSPAELARQAYARLSPPAPVPDFNPRRQRALGEGTVVGFATWFWLDSGTLGDQSATASAGPNAATVTARVASVAFDPGDGTAPVMCSGGGRPYSSTTPDAVSDCVHRYLQASAITGTGEFVLTARVVWSATWTGTGATGGTLPALTVSSQTPIRVFELQAVNE